MVSGTVGRREFSMLLDWEAMISKWEDDVVLSLLLLFVIVEVSCIVQCFA